MEYKVRLLPKANVDLVEIDANLADFPQKARRLFLALDKQLALLREMPQMYPVYEDVPAFRKMVVLDFLVFYTVDDAAREILIHRMRPGRMDYYETMSEEE